MEADTPPPGDRDVPAHGHGIAYALIALFALALAFGAWGLWRAFAPAPVDEAQKKAYRNLAKAFGS